MNRRNLIINSSKAALLLSFLPYIGCKTGSNSFILDLEEQGILQIQEDLKNGKYTIVDLVKYYLERIRVIDQAGPKLNSIIIVNPDAISIAEVLDKELQDGNLRGPLHGIPIVLKDNINTYDKMPTTAGSRALAGSIAPEDSAVTKQLRDAGAVILAKANLSEWANFRADFSSSGWSGVGGQTKNPYVISRNPCGSSSGSAVAVSANLTVLAIGTETNGSMVCPSNANGIVGIKPTVGLVSRSGIIPISFTQDTAGPMGRTVEDATICLGVLTQSDPKDSKTMIDDRLVSSDYTSYLKKDGLNGKKIGIYNPARDFHHKVSDLFDQAIETMKEAGAELVEIDQISDVRVGGDSFNIMLYEFKDGLNKYFASLGDKAPVKSVEELIEFNKQDSIELKYFDQDLLEMAFEKGDLESEDYKKALAKMLRHTREEGIDKVMAENGLDAIIAPTGSPAWKTDLLNGDRFLGGSSSPAAQSGYPSITCPMGFVGELPVGISIFGQAWTEGKLIEIAYAFEQLSKVRRAPRYLKE